MTEAVRRKPYSVVLLDEIEKGHNKVFETLLQVLDDGRMTDGQGNVVNFRNTIIIMTSNFAADLISERTNQQCFTAANEENLKNQLVGMLKARISPEFVNRINDIVLFHPLTKPVIADIARMQLLNLTQKMAERGINMSIDESVVSKIAEIGYVPEFGARPVKRAIEEHVVDNLTMKLLTGDIVQSLPIQITVEDGSLCFRNLNA